MESCIKCKRPAKVHLKHLQHLCAHCFAEIIEKRVRKTLREHNWIQRMDAIAIIDDGTVRFAVTKYLLESISKDLPMKLTVVKESSTGKTVIPWSLNKEVEAKLKDLFGEASSQAQHLPLLKNVTDEEIALFAKVKHLAGTVPEQSDLAKKLTELEEKYPGSTFGLLKSFQDLD